MPRRREVGLSAHPIGGRPHCAAAERAAHVLLVVDDVPLARLAHVAVERVQLLRVDVVDPRRTPPSSRAGRADLRAGRRRWRRRRGARSSCRRPMIFPGIQKLMVAGIGSLAVHRQLAQQLAEPLLGVSGTVRPKAVLGRRRRARARGRSASDRPATSPARTNPATTPAAWPPPPVEVARPRPAGGSSLSANLRPRASLTMNPKVAPSLLPF